MITSADQNKKLSNYNLPVFKSELTNGKEIRVLGTYDKPLFIAKDIAEMLGYKDTEQSIRKHVDIEDKISYSESRVLNNPVETTGLEIDPQTQFKNKKDKLRV